MAIIKCKMCGGDMELNTDQRCGTCEYCGSTMTLPKVDDEQRAAAFNRGNHFRRIGEFDKALTVYEHIVQEDEADAEAHWCCALCRFGIEYVKDPASGVYIPTCHRASFDSFLEDVDYKAALQYADAVARIQYQKDGEKIAEIQRNILSVSQKESPFDIFICYKESDEHGHRTIDSTLAQEIYYQLTEAGYRVFFSRITLEDKVGQEYEPYIFAALHSAKVMIVVGTKAEYLNAIWVKNEWGRYLALMKEDRKKLLIPCYRDMDPYDMPEQLSVLQSYDMSKIGFIQDLTRGISKVLNKEEKQTVRETVVVQSEGRANVDALLKRGYMALEDNEWKKAEDFFEQVLNLNAECAEAYWGKFLSMMKEKSTDTLIDNILQDTKKLDITKLEKLEAQQEDFNFVQEMVEKYSIPRYLEEDKIKNKLRYDFSFHSTKTYRQQQLDAQKNFWDTAKLYQRALSFASGEFAVELKKVKDTIISTMQQRVNDAAADDAEKVARINAKYLTHLDNIKAALQEEYKEAQKKAEQKHQNDIVRAAQKKKICTIAGSCIIVVVISFLIITQVVIPTSRYQEAEKLLLEQNYIGALAIFEDLGNYKDANERVLEVKYKQAEDLAYREDYGKAAIMYAQISDYQDSAIKSRELWNKIIKYNSLVTTPSHTVGIESDGKVLAMGDNDYGQCETSDWVDIISIVGSEQHTVGLKSDGTVVAAGYNKAGMCDVSGWTDIVAINCSAHHTVGLKSDGTVVAVGENEDGKCNVSDWEDVIAIACSTSHTVGLKSDGTVVATGYYEDGRCDVSEWSNIVSIVCTELSTVGLKADGTVVATGKNEYNQCNVSNWKDIKEIYGMYKHIVGLKSDDTVVATGLNKFGQCNVSDWKNIINISCGTFHTVGLKSDGTVVAVGENENGQCDVSNWRNIIAINCDSYNTAGLKSDGTVVIVGSNEEGQCDVSNWKNIKLP